MQEAAPTFIRWLWIWITVAALVVVVVIGFLLGIVGSLTSIDDNLVEADTAVTGIGGDAQPLPQHIQNINRNLTAIDKSLKPITSRADDIQNAVSSIRGRLGSVDASLVDTDASLADTDASLVDTSGQLGTITSSLADTSGMLGNISGSLVDTSGTLGNISGSLVNTSGVLRRISPSLVDVASELVSIRTLADRIDGTLVRAQTVRGVGTNAIWRRVRFINGGPFRRPGDRNDGDNDVAGPGENPNGLVPVKADAGNILGGLREVNKHLTSICEAPVLSTPTGIPLLVRPGAGPC